MGLVLLTACGGDAKRTANTSETFDCGLDLVIGDVCGGGVIVDVNYGGDGTWLVVSETDVPSVGVPHMWKTEVSGTAYAADLVDGRNNTGTFTPLHEASMACQNLDLNGFTDWYLPSLGEMSGMQTNSVVIGLNTAVLYWSSSNQDSGSFMAHAIIYEGAWVSSPGSVNSPGLIRCIRRPTVG